MRVIQNHKITELTGPSSLAFPLGKMFQSTIFWPLLDFLRHVYISHVLGN